MGCVILSRKVQCRKCLQLIQDRRRDRTLTDPPFAPFICPAGCTNTENIPRSHRGIDHSGTQVLMAQEFMDYFDVITLFQ